MSDVTLPMDKGRKTSGDRLRFKAGFLRRAENAIYDPNDDTRPHKMPGRTLTGSLPGAVVTAVGLQYLKFHNSELLLHLGESNLYRTAAGLTIGAWTIIDNQRASISPYNMTGDFLKVIPTGDNRFIIFSGDGQKPLIIDEDANTQPVGLIKPPTIGRAGVTATATKVVPDSPADSHTPPTTCSEGTVDLPWDEATKAYDSDNDTFALSTLSEEKIACVDFTFPTGSSFTGQKLLIKVGSSSLPPIDVVGFPIGTPPPSEPVTASLIVQVSEDGGTTFTNIFAENVPVTEGIIQYDLDDADDWSNIVVRGIFVYRGGVGTASGYIHEIWGQGNDEGNASFVTAGTYSYASVEKYTTELASGKVIINRSSPSDIGKITLDVDTHTGVKVTLGLSPNFEETYNPDHTTKRILTREIYRSTSTGAYPNLGRIGEVSVEATEFMDTFDTPGTTLGSIPLQVAYVEDAIFPLAGEPPAFLDAALWEGSIVAIDRNNPFQLKWSPKGFPEYYPFPHGIGGQSDKWNSAGVGVTVVGHWVLVFLRTRVLRFNLLPMVAAANFFEELQRIEVEVLSPSHGLAGSPLSYCEYHSQKGHLVVAWVSDDGIYMTDGSKVSERGLGLVKLTSHWDWARDVDTARLFESRLTYDSVLQAIFFDYYDTNGILRCETLHTSPMHWVQSGQDQMVPKRMGPHYTTTKARAVGVQGDITRVTLGQAVIRHWSMDAGTLKVYNERTGEDNVGAKILTHLESEYVYPAGPRAEVQVWEGSLDHSEWGPGEACEVSVLVRNDQSGHVQNSTQPGISLRGERSTPMGLINKAGTAMKFTIRHNGKTSSLAGNIKAFGPLILDVEAFDEARVD